MEVAAVQLGLSGIDARVVKGDRAERSIALLDLGPQDIAIGLAPYLTVTEIVGMLRAAKEAGLRTYAIVGGLSSPVARAADVVILAPKSYRSPLTAYSTPMAMLTAMAHAVAVQRPQVLTKSILNASELWTKMMRLDEPQMPDLEKFLEGWRLGEQNIGQNAS
jgi:DNA-binding MurR/RpiR family transcriptional regulator